MTNKTIAIIIFLLCVLANAGYAQNSAHAVMRVSVRVVSGRSVEAVQPLMVNLSKDNSSTLGGLKLKGVTRGNTLIHVTKNVILKSSDGKQIDLNISHTESRGKAESANLSFKGISKKKMLAGLYQGKLTTTIEYF
ncbi:MAG TPA: hypothetical protein VJ964_14525 [Balneolaceae bacterium]|nr:hypothetical protein [Balneolaceae bacterium]